MKKPTSKAQMWTGLAAGLYLGIVAGMMLEKAHQRNERRDHELLSLRLEIQKLQRKVDPTSDPYAPLQPMPVKIVEG